MTTAAKRTTNRPATPQFGKRLAQAARNEVDEFFDQTANGRKREDRKELPAFNADELGFLNRTYGAQLDALRPEELFELVHAIYPPDIAASVVNRIMQVNGKPEGARDWTAGRGELVAWRYQLLRAFVARTVEAPTNGKVNGKPVGTAAAKKTPALPASAPPDSIEHETAALIPLGLVSESPLNPRKFFDPAAVTELAKSLREHGQLQACIVRPLAGARSDSGKVEIILGARRFRAAKEAGLVVLKCVIRHVDDETAFKMMLAENRDREDISAIEEALALKTMIDRFGYTQDQLAATFRAEAVDGEKPKKGKKSKAGPTSQGQISNRLRLLELPEEWQQKIVEGKLPPSHARQLVPWVKYPRVLERLMKNLAQKDWQIGPASQFTEDEIDDALRECPGSQIVYYNEVKLAQQHAEEIGLINADYTTIAYNGAAWKRILAASKKTKATQRDQQEERAAKPKAGKLSPAEERARKKEQLEKFNKRLSFWYDTWLQDQIAQRVENGTASQAFAEKLLLFLATRDVGYEHCGQVDELLDAKKKQRGYGYGRSSYEAYAAQKDADVLGLVRKVCAAWMRPDRTRVGMTLADSEDLRAMGKELGIDPSKHWELTEDYLKLHNKAQLLELALEWQYVPRGARQTHLDGKKHSEIVADLLGSAKNRKPKPPADLLAVAKKAK
ncbi:MAG: ParB/RepB/Spo0J family partition protein [Thermoanaerobaculia bacterium]